MQSSDSLCHCSRVEVRVIRRDNLEARSASLFDRESRAVLSADSKVAFQSDASMPR
jgi:hypothetical protein